MRIQFFTTLGCHLCEQAEQLIGELQRGGRSDIFFEPKDIADDDALMERYGIRIPVVKRLDNGEEFGWPFDLESLSSFLDPRRGS
jgi:hypothetical protein